MNTLTDPRRRLDLWLQPRLALVLGATVALLLVPTTVISAVDQSAFATCGGSDTNRARETIRLAAARDIWLEFPAMLRAPVLEEDTRPAQVVVFEPGFDLGGMTVARDIAPGTVDTVICVIQSDGNPNMFAKVRLDGSRFTP